MRTKLRSAITLSTIAAAAMSTGCDVDWPSAAVGGTTDSMTIHIADCSAQGIVKLVVADRDSQELWRIQSDAPVPAWEIEYGVTPAGFGVLKQPSPLEDFESIVIETTIITGQGNEVPTQDAYVLERLRLGEVYVTQGKYVAPSDFQDWADDNVCPK